MKRHKILSFLLSFSLVLGLVSPALVVSASPSNRSPEISALDPASPDDVPILTCDGTGTGGDRADSRGIRFTVSESFSSVEVRMDAHIAGTYKFNAELRRSTGYLGAADFTQPVSVSVPGNSSSPPYVPVKINFGNVPVSGSETFTLRFTSVTGEGFLFFEVFGIGNKPCPNVVETEENNVADPTERGDPAGFKVLTPSPSTLNLTSTYTTTPPNLNGKIGFGEWQISNKIPFDNGFISVVNDSVRLYVLIDVLGDSGDDPTGDYFWLTFDVDQNDAITPNVDINYGLHPSNGNMRYQFYLGPSSWTGLEAETFSARGRGFGCFFGDGSLSITSFFPLNLKCSSHRVWELGIDLAEIGVSVGGNARMGFRVGSQSPSFVNNTPANFSADFTNLIAVNLASPPTPIPSANPAATIGLETKAVEITQAIQDRDNTLSLVEGKDTVGRVYVDVNGVTSSQPAKAYLYASKGGVDLPGSPLATLITAPTSINRAQLNHTANFLLPNTWNTGTVTFWSRAADMFGNVDSSASFPINFTAKEIPTVWIVPINTGTNASPVLVSNAQITTQESVMEAVLPLKDVNFVRKSWQVIGPTTVGNTIPDLNDYYNSAVLAWILSVIFTGKAPFELPDQIYGFTPSGGGSSDPTWLGRNGYVARGFRGTSRELTMVHEINHNLDRSSGGTWGRHVPGGCSATGPDSSWPYSNDDIQEVGFDTRRPWVDTSTQDSVIPGNFPDFMSYCQSGKLPTKWISPYRWQSHFNNFDTPVNTLMLANANLIADMYYISGVIKTDDTATLNPILVQPGIPTPNIAPGDYAIEVQDAGGTPLSTTPFKVSFEDTEGNPLDQVYINYQIPAQPGGAKIVLKKGETVLDSITASDNPPTVTVIDPNGGENWSGTQTINWTAFDLDGDQLSFTILYTPDNGSNWYPVASNVSGSSYVVDTATLPGGQAAKIRVIVSDGFNNAQDDSDDTFTIGDKAPEVTIFSPEDDSFFYIDTQNDFTGDALDLEDSSLPEEAFLWQADGHDIGIGRQISAGIPGGSHEISLSVVDSGENVGQAAIQIFVGRKIFLPILNR
jgi:hypothetical protein